MSMIEMGLWEPAFEDKAEVFAAEFDRRAAEINRLRTANAQLLSALRRMCDRVPYWFPHDSGHCDPAVLTLVTEARAAIKEAEGGA